MTRLLRGLELVPMLGMLCVAGITAPLWLSWLVWQWHKQRAEAERGTNQPQR